jgi:hypothetical protein
MGYLQWLLTIKLSSGLRLAVADELRRRGRQAPEPAPPAPQLPCPQCGGREFRHRRLEDALGRRHIRRACARCGQKCGFAPHGEPYLSEAEAAASPTAPLDLLLWCNEAGVDLKSDGKVADFASRADYLHAEPAMRELLEQCRAKLGRLMRKQEP